MKTVNRHSYSQTAMGLRFFATTWFILTAIPFACALGLFVDWQHDNAIIHQQAIMITWNLSTDSTRIHSVNEWVYHNQGFDKNYNYFILPALGPTPIQVLKSGGDCADKSRLVAAMLNNLNIEAGLVMISSCLHCQFIHTVVEARHERGRMVVDPIWNVDYPAPDGSYLGVRDLSGTNLGRERIAQLQRQRGATDKIAAMPATEATFDHAVSINWDKNIVTVTAATMLKLLGHSPETMFRPRFLEDPKLFLIIFCICIGAVVLVGRFLLRIRGGFARMIFRRRGTLGA
jgi:hypothetical protein